MKLEKSQIINGFRVKDIRDCAELGGSVIRMIHEKTGAELFWLNNGQENKVFGICFRTIPEDDTGVFHILEHSVLCGSEKYPVREPFVELLKSSMSTFLNAMTFPDMTLYPVSSRNDQDLLNLTEVYLDAVFAPACASQERIFRQEGWHIETDEDGNPVYKGVVLNEMKGAMSDVDSLIERQIFRQLFPDNGYGWSSGGDPAHIPELTYEEFRRQYARHYHPSNARIYLDGAVPMEKMLPLLAGYLDRYSPRTDLPVFTGQIPVASEETVYYELGQEESRENKSHLVLARIVGTWQDRADNAARGIICDVLSGNNEAPLRRAALERGLAQDLTVSIDDTGFQSIVSFHAERVTDGKEQEIRDLIRELGEQIAREGLDDDAVEASLNRAAYHLREEEEPQGIGRCIRCMGTWLYGGDPLEALTSDELIRTLREMLRTGRINELAADMLLNGEGMAVLHALPSHTLGKELQEAENRRLDGIVSGWSDAEREANEAMLADLQAWQQTPDTAEQLSTLPVLTREDADVEPRWIETEPSEEQGVQVLYHVLPCNGVVHFRAYFALTDVPLDQMTRAAGLSALLGKLPTRRHDALLLQQEIKRYT